jgi:hypothetical protein
MTLFELVRERCEWHGKDDRGDVCRDRASNSFECSLEYCPAIAEWNAALSRADGEVEFLKALIDVDAFGTAMYYRNGGEKFLGTEDSNTFLIAIGIIRKYYESRRLSAQAETKKERLVPGMPAANEKTRGEVSEQFSGPAQGNGTEKKEG